jgi:non-specific serine/threonine protein kinase/serine/threonine-protein kinase
MDTKEVVARFESERQALALMSHPNIAKVLDAGATEQGRPYFAMEFVKGVPITEYCDVHQLSTRERLALFIQVCGGVQHAHQKGVIHRDMKPSNVLVVMEGDRPVPKIIDFGVAKATAQRLTEQTVFTKLGQWIGTPEYMSPEQAEMTGVDVDTRTDVYSLGVMLYELLVGAVPFDPQELRRVGFDEMRRKIREEEPVRPSTRVSSLGDASQVAAKQRRTDLHGLVRTLRGDLDWITMRALEKDRMRRYASPSELSADIERHLRNEPVLAGPPSATYRLRKFVRRNRLGVTAAALVLVAIVIGGAAAMVGLLKAKREAAAARQVSELLIGVLGVMDPGAPFGHATSAARSGPRCEKISGRCPSSCHAGASLSTIGMVNFNLGRYDAGRPLLEKALAVQRRHLGEEHPHVAITLNALGLLHGFTADYAPSRQCFEGALRIGERSLGPDHPTTLTYRANLAWVLWKTGDNEGARLHTDRALELAQKSLAPNHPAVADILYRKGLLLQELATTRDRARPTSVAWRSASAQLVLVTSSWDGHSTTSACCTGLPGGTRSRERATSAPSPSKRRHSAPITWRSPVRSRGSVFWPCAGVIDGAGPTRRALETALGLTPGCCVVLGLARCTRNREHQAAGASSNARCGSTRRVPGRITRSPTRWRAWHTCSGPGGGGCP